MFEEFPFVSIRMQDVERLLSRLKVSGVRQGPVTTSAIRNYAMK